MIYTDTSDIGYASGKYGEREGTWRFQFKFHGLARKQGYNLLNTDLKNEISKIKDEDFFLSPTFYPTQPLFENFASALFRCW